MMPHRTHAKPLSRAFGYPSTVTLPTGVHPDYRFESLSDSLSSKFMVRITRERV